jgi:cytochrome c oxidase subunit II
VHLTRWSRGGTFARRALTLFSLLLFVGLIAACETNTPQSTTVIAGSHNEELWKPYRLIFWLAGIVFVVMMLITLVISLMFRERPGRAAQQIHGNTRLEVIWTIIPVAIVAIMAVPTVASIQAEAKAPPADALKVIAIGHQWWFEFRYPDLNITTANELHIPEGKHVVFEIRSQDVIHAFWVPQLAGKIDMMPGHVNGISFSGDVARPEPYLGQCAELCGLSHANMRFRVFVDTPADFDAWARKERTGAGSAQPTDTAARQGQEIFLRSACIGCHTVDGTAAAGTLGPNLSHVGSRSTIAAGTIPNTQDNLIKWINDSSDIKPGSKMPPMGAAAGGALSQEELRAVSAYLLALK